MNLSDDIFKIALSGYNNWIKIMSKDDSNINVDDKFSFYLQHVFHKPKRTNPKRAAKMQTKRKRVCCDGSDGYGSDSDDIADDCDNIVGGDCDNISGDGSDDISGGGGDNISGGGGDIGGDGSDIGGDGSDIGGDRDRDRDRNKDNNPKSKKIKKIKDDFTNVEIEIPVDIDKYLGGEYYTDMFASDFPTFSFDDIDIELTNDFFENKRFF